MGFRCRGLSNMIETVAQNYIVKETRNAWHVSLAWIV